MSPSSRPPSGDDVSACAQRLLDVVWPCSECDRACQRDLARCLGARGAAKDPKIKEAALALRRALDAQSTTGPVAAPSSHEAKVFVRFCERIPDHSYEGRDSYIWHRKETTSAKLRSTGYAIAKEAMEVYLSGNERPEVSVDPADSYQAVPLNAWQSTELTAGVAAGQRAGRNVVCASRLAAEVVELKHQTQVAKRLLEKQRPLLNEQGVQQATAEIAALRDRVAKALSELAVLQEQIDKGKP